MILVVNGQERDQYPDLMRKMHLLRAEVFAERRGWDVVVTDGLETDRFDEADPTYILSVDAKGQLKGSLRLLPTTGPNMLKDIFPILLENDEHIESPVIWESTRFCVTKEAQAERTPNRLNRTTAELLLGAFEVGQKAGLTHITSVYDVMIKRVLDKAGCHAEIIGQPQRIGSVLTYAGLFPVTNEMILRVRAAGGIIGSVLEPERQAVAA